MPGNSLRYIFRVLYLFHLLPSVSILQPCLTARRNKYSYGPMLFPPYEKSKQKTPIYCIYYFIYCNLSTDPCNPYVRTKTLAECCNLVRLCRVPLTTLQAPGLTSKFNYWHAVLVLAHPTEADDVILFFTSRTLHILIPTSRTLYDYHNWLLTVLYMGGQVP